MHFTAYNKNFCKDQRLTNNESRSPNVNPSFAISLRRLIALIAGDDPKIDIKPAANDAKCKLYKTNLQMGAHQTEAIKPPKRWVGRIRGTIPWLLKCLSNLHPPRRCWKEFQFSNNSLSITTSSSAHLLQLIQSVCRRRKKTLCSSFIEMQKTPPNWWMDKNQIPNGHGCSFGNTPKPNSAKSETKPCCSVMWISVAKQPSTHFPILHWLTTGQVAK